MATNLNVIFTWVDASYTINHDMRIQIGGEISMGLRATHCRPENISQTQKELFGTRNYFP